LEQLSAADRIKGPEYSKANLQWSKSWPLDAAVIFAVRSDGLLQGENARIAERHLEVYF
jgi:hypothetical protein